MNNSFEDLLEYLYVTGQVDEYLGLKKDDEEDEDVNEDENDNDNDNSLGRRRR